MELFDKCLAGKHRSRSTITGDTVRKYFINPFIIWCDEFAPPEKRDVQSEYVHLLFERGVDHEEAVRKTLFSDAVKISLESFEHGFKEVIEHCKSGSRLMVGAPLYFLEKDFHGVVDVLERCNNHPSLFGNYHYIIKEIKSAKHIKREYIMQAAFYNYLIGLIQEYVPPKFYLINREKEVFEYLFEDYETELMQAIGDIISIRKGRNVTPTAKSCKWPWESYCNSRAIDENDVSIVPSVGRTVKDKLNNAGIFTVQQLATQPIDINIPPATLQKIKTYAQAWVDRKPIVFSKPKLPKTDVEYFIDFEGTDELNTEEGIVKVDYLIGVLVKDKEVRYIPFIAEKLNEEEKMIRECFSFLKKTNGAIYHYGPYERTHIANLGQKYNLDASKILKRMVDVLSIVRKHVAFPTLSFSLKDVSKFLGFKYRGMSDAQESIVLYLQYLETKDKGILQRILDYNEDDVRATLVIKEFLEKL